MERYHGGLEKVARTSSRKGVENAPEQGAYWGLPGRLLASRALLLRHGFSPPAISVVVAFTALVQGQ